MITNPEIRSKLKNNKLVNKDKKELLFLYNASLNKKKEKEKYSNLRNIQISNFDLNSEKSEYTNENLNQKLNSSRNYLFRTYKNTIFLLLKSILKEFLISKQHSIHRINRN